MIPQFLPEVLKANLGFTPSNVFEIGSRDGHDAVDIARLLGVFQSSVVIFEAHPDLAVQIRQRYPNVTVFNNACSNENGILPFHSCIMDANNNHGMSSLAPRSDYDDPTKYKTVNIDTIRMDDWMAEYEIKSIDFLKLDVEGKTWEVLDGFGARLKDVKVIHLEAERKQFWEGQKLFSDVITKLLPTHHLVHCIDLGGQSDSIWIEKESVS
jgi:FkbM family methyltransferase